MLGGRGRRSPLSATERRFARARRGRGDRCGFCGGRYPRGRDRCPRLAIGMATPTGGGSGWPAGRKPAARARKVGSVAYALSTREKLRRESGATPLSNIRFFPRTCLINTQSQTCPTLPDTRLTRHHTPRRGNEAVCGVIVRCCPARLSLSHSYHLSGGARRRTPFVAPFGGCSQEWCHLCLWGAPCFSHACC